MLKWTFILIASCVFLAACIEARPQFHGGLDDDDPDDPGERSRSVGAGASIPGNPGASSQRDFEGDPSDRSVPAASNPESNPGNPSPNQPK